MALKTNCGAQPRCAPLRASARVRAAPARAKKSTKALDLTPRAKQLYEELSNDSSRVLDLDNIIEGFYIAPKFLDKLAVHCAKNYMHKALTKIKVPLILGVWGGKGQGKTFQVTLALRAMGAEAIIMSAGELEAGNAGEPAKLLRQRYREAGDFINKGKMASLFINDLDAGAGRMGESTQYTVNNQMVNATLMNIADNPTNVQLPGVYKDADVARVPIVCTGNDFSTLYAPLIRDGRMEKYYWNPSRADRIGVCKGIFKEDNLTEAAVIDLVDNFPGQSIDFFGALRARIYDDAVRGFTANIGIDNMAKELLRPGKDAMSLPKPDMTKELLMDYGRQLVEEQDNVKRVQLAEEYIAGASLAGSSGSSLPEEVGYKAKKMFEEASKGKLSKGKEIGSSKGNRDQQEEESDDEEEEEAPAPQRSRGRSTGRESRSSSRPARSSGQEDRGRSGGRSRSAEADKSSSNSGGGGGGNRFRSASTNRFRR